MSEVTHIDPKDTQSLKLLIGRRVRCNIMNDPYHPVPSGTEGTIEHIDGINQIHVKWDNGSSLALVPEVDTFQILDRKCTNGLYQNCGYYYHQNCVGCPMFK